MAICKMCHKIIPDGMDFCDECENKRTNQADESYLDSLLSSVTADDSETKKATDFYPKKAASEPAAQNADDGFILMDSSNEETAVEEVADEFPAEEIIADEVSAVDEIVEELPSDELSVDDLPGDDLVADELSSDDLPVEEPAVEDISAEDVPVEDLLEEVPEEVSEELASEDTSADKNAADEDVDDLLDGLLAEMDAAGDTVTEEDQEPIGEDDLSEIFAAAEQESSEVGVEEPEAIEPLPGDDLFSMDEATEPVEDISMADIEGLEAPEVPDPGDFGGAEPGAGDLELLGGLSIDELSGGDDAGSGGINIDADASQFLSESALEDTSEDTDSAALEVDLGDLSVESLLDDLDDGTLDETLTNLDADALAAKKEKKKKKKKSLFERLFANVVEELTPEQIALQKAKEENAARRKAEAAEKKKQQKEMSKEEKAAAKEEAAKAKEEEAKKKAEEKKRKAEEAKARAQKKKEERLALEALEVNEGRINRAGASILFVIFAVFAIFIILGTNIYYYNISIKNAQTEFDRQHYNEAYYQVYGLKIKDKDIELYDKIMTVMYVKAQENAYEHYMTVNDREKALDSLLKGLQRYDKYLELATLLDIEDDLNYVKSDILEELATEFDLSESDAYSMMSYVDSVDYSEYIYALLGNYEVELGE